MKISKSSMLYRSAMFHSIVHKKGFYPSNDLCAFLRTYVWCVLCNMACGFGILLMATAAIYDAFVYFHDGSLVTNIFSMVGFLSWVLVFIFLVVLAIAFIIGGSFLAWEKLMEREPGAIRTYLAAKKENYCPTIQFVE